MNLNLLLSCLFLLNAVTVIAGDDLKSVVVPIAPKKPYRCKANNCGKWFAKLGYLIVHRTIHSDKRPFICTHVGCDKAFKRKGHLNSHAKTHDCAVKPHSCIICGYASRRSCDLKRHTKSQHSGGAKIKRASSDLDKYLAASGLVLSDLTIMNDWHDSDDDITPSVGPAAKKRAVAGIVE